MPETNAYQIWSDSKGSLENAASAFGENVDEYSCTIRSTGSDSRTFINEASNTSVRDAFNRGDHDYYRTAEAIPTTDAGKIQMSFKAYENIGLVRNIIDMMGDFVVQGIRIVHPVHSIEDFHRRWWTHISGASFSERMANTLFRVANCPVKSKYGTMNKKVEKEWKKSTSKDEVKLVKEKFKKRSIPLEYNIMNPLSIEIIGGELAAFIGDPIYAMKVTHTLTSMLNKFHRAAPNNRQIREMMETLPVDLQAQNIKGNTVIPLDQNKFEMLHYKKDDWQVWATPMLHAIMNNLIMLEKMHLADLSALDGAISQVRLWTLGILEEKIRVLPSRAAFNKLRNILARLGTGGSLDLVWGPELKFTESNTNVHQFLGSAKYEQVMTELYAGMGVPASLTGGGTDNFTNSAISMKTFIEKLEYVRRVIVDFWNKELRKIQKAMGWDKPAKIIFDHQVLSDDAAEKQAIINLWDRGIVSTRTILEMARRDPELEALRVRQEMKMIESGRMPEKASPYHNPQTDHDLAKIALQGGSVSPSQVGLELDEKKEGETNRNEDMEGMQLKLADKKASQDKIAQKKNSGAPTGRPKNQTDKSPRKKRTDKPRSLSAEDITSMVLWANEMQKRIASFIQPAMLKHYKKKNMRSMSKDENSAIERLKFGILCKMEPYDPLNKDLVYNILSADPSLDSDMLAMCQILATDFHQKMGKEPNLDEMHQIQSTAYAFNEGE